MAETCFTPIFGKRIRVTALDICGNVPEAAAEDSLVTTDGFVSVKLSSQTEDANEIITKKADGSLCVNEKTDASFKYFTVEMEFCGVDPGLLSLTTNAEIYEDAAMTASGIVVPEGTIDKKFALELWTGLTGGCEASADSASGYLLLPFINAGVLGDIEVTGDNAITFSMTTASTRGGNAWGVGPYDIFTDGADPAPVLTPLPTALDPLDHLLLITSSLAPPESACGLQAMPAAV